MAILVAAAAIALGSGNAAAQPASAPPASAKQVDSRAVIADVRRILADNYVLADVRPKLDAALAKGLASGRYDVADPTVLADRINADLSAVAHDKHLGIQFAPDQAKDLASRPDGGADDAPPSAEEMRQADRLNHGITQLKVLPGNIRYMELIGFFWGGPKTAAIYDDAMRFLSGADVVVIDLRRNGGGSPEAVQYLISHFVEPNKPIVTFYMGKDKVDRKTSLASLPAGRIVGKPLYVLTSARSASAAEEFIGHVAGFRLGEVIGETSAGAGFRNSFFPVAGGYVISVSVGRAVLASTGKDWEGVGIAPTTKVDPDKALEVAQSHALKRLASAASRREKRALEAQATLLEAQVTPVQTALPLARYAGLYGERSVALDDGKLLYSRLDGPKVPLIAVGANEFAFAEDPLARIRFNVAGNAVTGLELIRGDGSKVTAERSR
jgi:hypothetical protein